MSLKFWKRKKKKSEEETDNLAENSEQQEKNKPQEGETPPPELDENGEPVEKKPGVLKRLGRAFLLLLLLILLVIAGFVLGVYLRIIDSGAAEEQLKKHDIPIIGEYLAKLPVKPETPDEPKEEQTEPPKQEAATETKQDTAQKPDEKKADENKNKDKDKEKEKEQKKSKTIKLTKEEIEKQAKEREAAEKKRVSKLARLYMNMKAQEAAAALQNLDDNMITAKIMAQFDPARTARITRIMFVGVQQRVTVPADVAGQNEPRED